MRAAVLHAPGEISTEEVPDPTIVMPTDALVRVTAACICGSDLWPYRGIAKSTGRIGHEFVGVVEEVGAAVESLTVGQVVIAPFVWSCGKCENCVAGWTTSCLVGGGYGAPDPDGHLVDGGQGEYVRVPQADGTLVVAPVDENDERMPALLSLSDVMGTGHHAAVSAGVGPGSTVVVIGDGAVGLCAVLAAHRLGAERIIALSTHADRAAMATSFGATDIVNARGDEAVSAVRELTGGLGAASVCECVGTTQTWDTALAAARPGGTVGFVGVPAGVSEGLSLRKLFNRNVSVHGGVAPTRVYLPELLDDVLAGTLDPGPVFTTTIGLEDIATGYDDMDKRRSIKVLVKP
ncbi:zinc-dependent alcohol dehydrogenase family protein [Nakamurella sp. PAMC28650]|jgi:threonine dehydrogenase-like Zn-dependent dehydrogenase|uniref:zinc-dependent alcohol dehydrogenase family protein n=1 Tax=Nakamurella sp. PAMC28650 TaxID=2762325 RepID=UPI00164D1613|nr:zinc-dependent alcohol dehydrogenase family protein [Nakamurella sp. PAMC28650]QNK82309.1 zinc-dependent alcohol dehydrogenase family protein [Nakamurella sp. PAMC28650]